MRIPIIAGNWKMHKTISEAIEAGREIEQVVQSSDVEVVICPPFTALSALSALGLTKVKLGAQNMCAEVAGAYTGEVSVLMLRDTGCQYVVVGHSERRELYGETDELVNQKALLALEHGLHPIICVGETLAQRKAGETERLVIGQIERAFTGINKAQVHEVVVAYEPVWAIGTGETASAEDANAVIVTIRQTIAKLYGDDVASEIRIQYGGSVKPANARELMKQSDIDGALVGGASLQAEDFGAIVNYK